MLPDTEVSELLSIAPEPMSQDATSQGESFKTTEPITWFQSMTDHFQGSTKSMSHRTISNQHYLPMYQSTPCKYIENQFNSRVKAEDECQILKHLFVV